MNTQDKVFAEKIRTTDAQSLISRYYAGIEEAARRLPPSASAGFAPAFSFPKLNDCWEEFFDVAQARWAAMGSHAGMRLNLLDLMRNPATRTTKTTASLLMVARAVHHIEETGDPVLIFTPSSGNKAIALRDAVARALRLGLTTPDKLRVVTLTPASTLYKFRRNVLTEDEELRALNPILVYSGPEAGAVKEIGRSFTDAAAGRPVKVWYSLDIGNYKIADSCRAFYEHEFTDLSDRHRRLHAHAVSSAYGLLGYQHGLDTMAAFGIPHPQPGFLLVQHLATSDMVRHCLSEQLGEPPSVSWKLSPHQESFSQHDSPHFPQSTWDPGENLEPTFYTQAPPTAPQMTSLIARHGGTGIVVSLQECLQRYGEVRHLLGQAGCQVPADPRRLDEWSLVMGVTGILNALDRDLIHEIDQVVLHASGMYLSDADQTPDRSQARVVSSADDVAAAVGW